MKYLIAITLWFPAAISALILSLVLFASIDSEKTRTLAQMPEQPIIPASQVLGSYHSNIISEDARPEIVARFLERYQCPLEPYDQYAQVFIKAADAYQLDFRLLPAISMQESNCCKKMPDGSNNCWGFGIYGDKVTRFDSIEQGIDTVGKTLARNYTSEGLMEPDEIMRKYTPSSKGSWAYGVLFFMNEMK